jgi:phage tail sheath protein FI
MRDWGFASDSALMFFPRLLALDKLRGRFESFGSCGAVAGMLARADEQRPVWAGSADVAVLRPGMRPLCVVGDVDRARLAALGVNTLSSTRSPGGALRAAVTLAGPGAATPEWRLLGRRRLALFILNSIERGTRWMLFESNGPPLWSRASAQLRAFFEALDAEGAFADCGQDERWFVVCDERLNREYERARGMLNLAFGFATGRPGHYHSFLVSHRAGGSRVRPLNLNPAQARTAQPDDLLAGLARQPLVQAG